MLLHGIATAALSRYMEVLTRERKKNSLATNATQMLGWALERETIAVFFENN